MATVACVVCVPVPSWGYDTWREIMQIAETGKETLGGGAPRLSPEEQEWLADYRQELNQAFPGMVEEIVVFGSKARGDSTEDSDLDLLLVIREGDWRLKEAIARPGYLLAAGTDVVPSMMVYTVEEWEQRRRGRAPLWQTVTRDGVPVS